MVIVTTCIWYTYACNYFWSNKEILKTSSVWYWTSLTSFHLYANTCFRQIHNLYTKTIISKNNNDKNVRLGERFCLSNSLPFGFPSFLHGIPFGQIKEVCLYFRTVSRHHFLFCCYLCFRFQLLVPFSIQ